MNPDEQVARQAMMQRMLGNPQPVVNQIGPGAGTQLPVQANPVSAPQDNLGTPARKASPHESLIKGLLPATSDTYDPEIQGMSKALLAKLIPYLSHH